MGLTDMRPEPLPCGCDECGGKSNSEIRRLLSKGSIQINETRPKEKDNIDLPIWDLVFFPKGKRKTTMFHCFD